LLGIVLTYISYGRPQEFLQGWAEFYIVGTETSKVVDKAVKTVNVLIRFYFKGHPS